MFKLLVLSLILGVSYASKEGHSISLPIKSRHDLKVITIPSEESDHITYVDVPGGVLPVYLTFKTQSSPVYVRQEHRGTKGSFQRSSSKDEEHRLVHEVIKPVLQELKEIIIPRRKVIQIIEAVQEDRETRVHKGERRSHGNDGGYGGSDSGKGYSGDEGGYGKGSNNDDGGYGKSSSSRGYGKESRDDDSGYGKGSSEKSKSWSSSSSSAGYGKSILIENGKKYTLDKSDTLSQYGRNKDGDDGYGKSSGGNNKSSGGNSKSSGGGDGGYGKSNSYDDLGKLDEWINNYIKTRKY